MVLSIKSSKREERENVHAYQIWRVIVINSFCQESLVEYFTKKEYCNNFANIFTV